MKKLIIILLTVIFGAATYGSAQTIEGKSEIRATTFCPVDKKILFQVNKSKSKLGDTTIVHITYSGNAGNNMKANFSPSGNQSKGKRPVLRIISPQNVSTYNLEKLKIKYEIESDGATPEITILIDGKEIDANSKGVRRAFDEIELTLPTKEGTREIELIAENQYGQTSRTLSLKYVGKKPVLHTLAVGVGKYGNNNNPGKLKYAAKDAVDFASTVYSMETTSKIYKTIEKPVVLTDEQAATNKIKSAIANLKNKIQEDDVAMLFFSGHGVKSETGTDYFFSYDSNKDDLLSTALKFNDITEGIKELNTRGCKVIVFMDACNAGGLGTKGLQSIQFSAPGDILFMSSRDGINSLESKKYPNGVFTGVLIEGLKGGAKDENGNVTTLKLENYIKDIVNKETNNVQSPTVKNNLGGEYMLF